MSFKFLTLILLATVAPRAYSRDPGEVRRMRGVPANHNACALVVSWEELEDDDRRMNWEVAIDFQNAQLNQILESARQNGTTSYQKLLKAREQLLKGEGPPDLLSLTPFAGFLDDATHTRWVTLRERGVRLGTVDLSNIPYLGADAEFGMTYFDHDEDRLLLNVALGLDNWVYSTSSKDVEDLDVVMAGQLASALFVERTTQFAHFNESFVEFCRQLALHNSELADAFETGDFQGVRPWEADPVGQIWMFLKERLALQESLRVYSLLRAKGHLVYSFQMQHLENLNTAQRLQAIESTLQMRYDIKPEVIKALRYTITPKEFLR